MRENGWRIQNKLKKMKKLPLLLLTLLSLFALSCSSSDETPEVTPVPEAPEIVDDFKFLSINSEGKIFEIGNNTGQTTNVGQIANQSNLIMLSSICQVGTKIYALEASYVPAPNILTIYDKSNGTTTTHQLILPLAISSAMMDPFITNLEYNGSELIAIVSENMPSSTRPSKIISINLQNFQTTDLAINLFQKALTSSELIDNKLYVSTKAEGLIEINLTEKTIVELQANGTHINGTRLVKINNTRLALMKFGVPQLVNGVKPFELNLNTNLFSDKSAGNVFAVGNITGGTVFHNNEYLNLVFNEDHKFGILKINYENNERDFVELDQNIIGSNAIIVDIIQ